MPLDFPNAPAVDQTYSGGPNGGVWRYDGAKWLNDGGGTVPPGLIAVTNVPALRAGTAASLGGGPVLVQYRTNAAAGGGGVYILGATASDNGGTIINDSSGRSWYLQLNGQPVSITNFGALVDGTTDDTAAIQAADAWSRANGSWPVLFPAGITRVRQLIVYTGSNWQGVGRANPIAGQVATTGSKIKQLAGTTGLDVILGNNSYTNFGQTTGTTYVDGYTLRNLTVDGSWQDGGNTGGSGVVIFGCKPLVRDLFITNCADYGLYTGWFYADPYPPSICPGFDAWTMEAAIDNVHIDTCGKHGWNMDGPHDSVARGVRIVDAGRSANNTWSGLVVQAGGGGLQLSDGHIWTRRSTQGSATVRLQYAVNATTTAHLLNVQMEGAYIPLNVTGWSNVKHCMMYGAAGGVCIALQGSGNNIHGYCSGPATGFPVPFGVQFYGSAGSVSDNNLDLTCNTDAGVVNFGSGLSGGGNRIRIHAILNANETFNGTPHPNDDLHLNINNTAGQGVYSSGYIIGSRTFASAIGISSGGTYNPASISVPPGTWELWGNAGYGATSGTVTFSSVNSQIGVGSPSGTGSASDGMQTVAQPNVAFGTGTAALIPAGHGVVTLYATTTIYLCLSPIFSGGGAGGFGSIHAKRLG